MTSTPATISVSAVHNLLGDALADLGTLSVRGEISSLTIAQSGRAYITLRDRDATLNVTMWRSAVVRHSPFPKEGDQIVCKGRLETYAPRGSLSMIASTIRALLGLEISPCNKPPYRPSLRPRDYLRKHTKSLARPTAGGGSCHRRRIGLGRYGFGHCAALRHHAGGLSRLPSTGQRRRGFQSCTPSNNPVNTPWLT